MGCCGQREKFDNPDNEQKWDYINLSDFHSSSCLTPLSYGVLYIFLLISVAVYAVDLFTCVNLLFFDKWSGQVKPAIPFEISRWIFTACIILSYILLVYRWWRAIRAMKTGVVAASYLDPLAVRVQSIRMGSRGRGWRRFLVFAALTKGRKGAEYVALFTYFSFEAWLRICFAEGPRQVINALTLYSVMQADLVPTGKHAASHGNSPAGQFFVNFQILADGNKEQAAILFGMLFTLVIWIFSALSLLMATIFYITFLWHHIRDGSLSRYCRRKIDTRLHKIVMIRVNRALEKDSRARGKQEAKGVRVGPQGDFKRQPTIPTVPVLDNESPQEIKSMSSPIDQLNTAPSDPFPLSPEHLHREPTVPDVLTATRRPQPPSRSTTQSSAQSNMSYTDNAPLIGAAAPLGRGPPESHCVLPRSNHDRGSDSYGMSDQGMGRLPLGTQNPMQTKPGEGAISPQHLYSSEPTPPTFPSSQPFQNRRPAPPSMPFHPMGRSEFPPSIDHGNRQEYEMQPQPSGARVVGRPPRNGGYVAFKPPNQGRGAGYHPPRHFTQKPPPRNLIGSCSGPPQRSGTAPIPTASYNDDLYDAYGGSWQEPQATGLPVRPATAGPGAWNGSRRAMPPRY